MLGSNTDSFRAVGGTALCAILAAGIFACASSSSPPDEMSNAGASIVDVLVESSPEGSMVTIIGPEQPVFTAFQQGDPDRVIVDLAGVDVGAVMSPIDVRDGVVEEIRIEPVASEMDDAMARIEVTLAGPADYDVRMADAGLVIEMTPLASMSSMDDWESDDAMDVEDPWAITPASDLTDASDAMEGDSPDATMDESDPTEAPMPSQAAEAGPATVLSSIDAQRVGEGSLIHLMGDGTVESAMSFTLENPARLVVDLPEMRSEVESQRIDVGSDQVAQIRIGEHSDKVRVVIDAGSGEQPFSGRRVLPVASGLVIALGAGAELDDAVAEATGKAPEAGEALALVDPMDEDVDDASADPELTGDDAATGADWADDAELAMAEPMQDGASEASDSGGLVTIYGVEFDPQAERDRVVILGEEPVDYLVYEPDPETVVLSISGAVIGPDAQVRIAPETGEAVSLVTAFAQPDVSTPEVRVVVKRAPNLVPEVSRRGSLLIMDFVRTGALAATPPIFDGSMDPAAEGQVMGDATVMAAADPMDPSAGESMMAGDAMMTEAAPAAMLPGAAPVTGIELDGALADAGAGPAPASIEILNEGGLMDGKEYVGRRISLDFKEVDVADVLRLIAEVSDLNVIAGDEVKGKVTIRLVDVPWDQAMDVILLTKGLGFVRIGNVLRIAASDVIAQEEEMRLQERRAREKLEDLVVKLQPVNYADVSDVSGMVSELLTARGSVNTDTRTNTLIIKDIASVIDEATALVKAVDTMTPQVMIEAKIVEAGLEFSRELGSLWTFGANPETEATLGGRDYTFVPGQDDNIAEGFGSQVVFGNPITAGATGLLTLAATVLEDKFAYEVEIQAAEVNGDGKVISSPRIMTLDNSTATIEQGVSIPFQTFENGDAQLEFVDAVLKLKVTPHITSDRSIIMEIEVSRNAPDDSVFTLTGSPAIAKNQVKTETLVKDGQTLVLGGIYVVDRSERESRVPYLSKLPLLGNLFKSNEFSDSRKELLIFVSPRIVQIPGLAS